MCAALIIDDITYVQDLSRHLSYVSFLFSNEEMISLFFFFRKVENFIKKEKDPQTGWLGRGKKKEKKRKKGGREGGGGGGGGEVKKKKKKKKRNKSKIRGNWENRANLNSPQEANDKKKKKRQYMWPSILQSKRHQSSAFWYFKTEDGVEEEKTKQKNVPIKQ